MLRKACVSIIIIFITFSLIINAYSVNIDGTDDGYEWDGALSYQFINGESNCNVDYAIMKLLIDNENRAVYFCFLFRDSGFEPDNICAGVSFSINDSTPFVITVNSKSDDYDTTGYSFDGMITVDKNHGAICEVRLGFKDGIPQNLNGTVSFIDSNGMSSNKYDFMVVNEGYTERTATQIANTDDVVSSSSKTTKAKTTSKKEIKDDETERNENRRTTTERIGYTTDEFIISTSPLYVYSRTSKPSVTSSEAETTSADKSTTKKKSTTETKTKKSTTKNNTKKEKVTVYYYEKEIIVYTDKTAEVIENTSVTAETTADSESSDYETAAESEASIPISKGIKYKTIISVVSAVLIALLAAWASKSSKKEKNT